MGIEFSIYYHQKMIKEDISKLSVENKLRIRTAIENKLSSHPEIFGAPLRGIFNGYRKLRIRPYRVIFNIEKNKIKVLAVGHRSIVYKNYKERL